MILAFCEEPEILNLILFLRSIIDVICILVPIALVVMVSVELGKIVFSASDKTVKSATKGIFNKIIATIVIFFIMVVLL